MMDLKGKFFLIHVLIFHVRRYVYLVMAAVVPAAPDRPTTARPGAAVMTCWAVTVGAGVRVALEVAGSTGLTACESVGILKV